jgi:O-antigen/teichoic acid export membrane protein
VSNLQFKESLTSGRLLARNIGWNSIGEVAPVLIALITTPLLLHRLGTDRYGVLALAWMVFGFFGFLDFGLGSAIIKLSSDKLACRRESEVAPLTRTCIFMLFGAGSVAAAALLLASHVLALNYLKVPEALQNETERAFYLMALSLPVVVSSRGYWGVLTSYQRFGWIALVQSTKSLFLSIAPAVVALFSNDLRSIFLVLAAGHAIFWLIYFIITRRIVPGLTDSLSVDRASAGALISFGGWAAGSSAANLVMTTFDRSILAAMMSVGAVTYYAVPQRVIARLRMIPYIFGGVLYPALTQSLSEDRERTIVLFDRAVKSLLIILFPAVVLAVAFAPELLRFWLGTQFAEHATATMRWLAVAALLAGVAELPHTLLAAAHRPDISAMLCLLLIAPYFFCLRWCIVQYGVEGAAIALALRFAADAVFSMAIAAVLMPRTVGSFVRLAFVLLPGMLTLPVCASATDFWPKTAVSILAISAFLLAAWSWLCTPEDRKELRHYIRTITSAASAP